MAVETWALPEPWSSPADSDQCWMWPSSLRKMMYCALSVLSASAFSSVPNDSPCENIACFRSSCVAFIQNMTE